MATLAPSTRQGSSDDPRRLRDLLARTQQLSLEHNVPSVIVGLAAPEGDLLFPELVAFIESALRVEDGLFRLTRERALLFLSDTTRERARQVMDRLMQDFRVEFPTAEDGSVWMALFPVDPGTRQLAVKDVLPAIFAGRSEDDPPSAH